MRHLKINWDGQALPTLFVKRNASASKRRWDYLRVPGCPPSGTPCRQWTSAFPTPRSCEPPGHTAHRIKMMPVIGYAANNGLFLSIENHSLGEWSACRETRLLHNTQPGFSTSCHRLCRWIIINAEHTVSVRSREANCRLSAPALVCLFSGIFFVQ